MTLITLTLVSMLCGGVPSIGSLAEGPDPSWLLDDEGQEWAPVAQLSRARIQLELEVLQARRRGGGWSGAMVVGGLVLFTVGLALTPIGIAATVASGLFAWPVAIGVVALVAGIGLFVLGISESISIGQDQARHRYRIQELERALVAIDGVTIARF